MLASIRAILPTATLLALCTVAPLCGGPGTSAAASASGDTLVARVGTREIDLAEFRRSWRRLMLAERPQGSARDMYRSFLDDIVVRQLLAEEARQHPKKLLPGQEQDVMALKETLMRNRLFEVEVVDRVRLEGFDLERFARELQWILDLRAYVFDDRAAAEAWYTRLVGGTPISRLDELAVRREPDGPRAYDLGGRIREQLSDSVSAVVFDLPPGRFSRPVPEWGVYAIYRMMDKRSRGGEKMAVDSPVLRSRATQSLADQERDRYRRQLGVEVGVRYETSAVDTLLNRFLVLPARVGQNEEGVHEFQAYVPLPTLMPTDSALVLARSRDGQVTGRDLMLVLAKTPAYSRADIRSRAQLLAWIDRVAFDQELLRRAHARGLENDPEVVREVDRRREGFQVEMLYADSVESQVTFPEDSLRALYEADSTSWDLEERLKAWLITTDSRADAVRYLTAVQEGASADSIAKNYSIHPQSAARGGLFEMTRNTIVEHPELEEAIFRTPVGGYGGPIQSTTGWMVFRVLQKDPGTDRHYGDVIPELRQAYQPREEERILQSFLVRLRSRYPVTVFPENLAYLETQLAESPKP
jgi:hypothetical protein